MTEFLLKSTLSMAVLLGFYHLLLEREKMHRFNRFYLLGAIVISLIIPFITIPVYVQVESLPQQVLSMQTSKTVSIAHAKAGHTYWSYAAWGLYILIATALLIRFTRNILHFTSKVTTNTTVPYKKATLVLLQESVLPHTFMNYIFVNEQDYQSRKIEDELYTHELVHVAQKHTLDILFVELFKILFWFNPLAYLFKRAIQLNHEFLADEQVVRSSADVINYQHLLLGMASAEKNHALASSLTFSITKKRLLMMTKNSNKPRTWLLKLASLPVITGLAALMCIQAIAQESNTQPAAAEQQKNDQRRDAYYSGVRVIIDDRANGIKIDKLFEELTEEEKDKYYFYAPEPYAIKHPSKKAFELFKNKKGYLIFIDGEVVDNTVLNGYKPSDLAYYTGYTIAKESLTKEKPQTFHYLLYTLDYFNKNLKGKNTHYPGDVFEMTFYREFKDGKAVSEGNKRKTFNNVKEAMEYLGEKQ